MHRVRFPWEDPDRGFALSEVSAKHCNQVALPPVQASQGLPGVTSDAGEREGYRDTIERMADRAERNANGGLSTERSRAIAIESAKRCERYGITKDKGR